MVVARRKSARDDEPARVFARTLGITVRDTLGILIQATKSGVLRGQEAIRMLNELTETIYISADLYKAVRKEICCLAQFNGLDL